MALKQLGAAPSSAVDAATKGYVDAGNSGALKPVRVLADGTYTHTIAAGSVSQIAGTTIDGVSIAIGDRILVVGAPATTGAGTGYSTQPGNGIYVVTGNTTNLTLARATDFSGNVVPWFMNVAVREGTAWGLGYVVYWRGAGAFIWGTTALVGYSGYNRLQSGAFIETPLGSGSVAVSDLATSAVTTSSETIAANDSDSQIPTTAAVKDYADIVNVQLKTSSYTLAAGDQGTGIGMNVASANTVTLPSNATAAILIGSVIPLFQYGAGQTTIVQGSGATVRAPGGKLKFTAQYSQAVAWKVNTNEWMVTGDLVL